VIGPPTAVYFDTGRRSWVVEYGAPDRQEQFGAGPLSEDRARDRAEAMGLRRVDQNLGPAAVALSNAFSDRDWE
jgi:hypothetical protein